MTLKLYGSGSIENVDSIVTSASANISGTELGFLDGINGIGKVLQIVRATDSTQRTTTSTSFVDVTGMSVTITPQTNTSAVLLMAVFLGRTLTTNAGGEYKITDSSNNSISGAEQSSLSISGVNSDVFAPIVLVAYATPATTSAVTYKLRMAAFSGRTIEVRNDRSTGQMFALEVGA